MRKARKNVRFTPSGCERMEDRLVLSAASVHQISALTAKAKAIAIALSGDSTGTYVQVTRDPLVADAPLQFVVSTTGKIKPVGHVTISGSIYFGGFRPATAPAADGQLTLSNGRGTLTIDVQGKSFALHQQMKYSVVSGTGEFARYRGHGRVGVWLGTALTETTGPARVRFKPVGA